MDLFIHLQVDQLLAPQYREELTRIDQHTGRKIDGPRQTIIVSATLSDKVCPHCMDVMMLISGSSVLVGFFPKTSISWSSQIVQLSRWLTQHDRL